ncbi:YoaK family protein [Jiella sp. M17.18]|uniref:YoaK family protein n=1 Tax=Jiella sp. M17.18 TaxID=3234247 RepID=UPI0034DFE76E
MRQTLSLERSRTVTGLVLVALLSFLGGMSDAIGFILGGNFLSFMSGNTTRLAIAVGEGRGIDVLQVAAILTVFVAGNAAGVMLAAAVGYRLWPLLLGVSILIGLSALADGGMVASVPVLLPVVLAMGVMNAAVEGVAGHPVGLTYVTGALSRFGKGLGRWLTGEPRTAFLIQLIPWGGMFAGAVTGTLLQLAEPVPALWAAAALAALLVLFTALLPLHWQRSYLGAEHRLKRR